MDASWFWDNEVSIVLQLSSTITNYVIELIFPRLIELVSRIIWQSLEKVSECKHNLINHAVNLCNAILCEFALTLRALVWVIIHSSGESEIIRSIAPAV